MAASGSVFQAISGSYSVAEIFDEEHNEYSLVRNDLCGYTTGKFEPVFKITVKSSCRSRI